MLTISAAKLVRLPTTRDIYERTVHLCGESGRNCQVRLGAPSSPGDSRSHGSNAEYGRPPEPTAGSTMIVPPWPSLDRLKFCAESWPSNLRLPVCVPSVTVSVPLRWFLSSLKNTFVFLPKEMFLRSISSVTPEGEAKPAIEP
jgi:hypothetical protein